MNPEQDAQATDADAISAALKPVQPRWYRRRALAVTLGVVVVVVITVISDLPVHASRAADIWAGRGVMSEINSDTRRPCAYAVQEAFIIHGDEVAGSLTASDGSAAPGLLRDDQDHVLVHRRQHLPAFQHRSARLSRRQATG